MAKKKAPVRGMLILGIALAILLVFFGILFQKTNNTPISSKASITQSPSNTQSPKIVLESLKNTVSTDALIAETESYDWYDWVEGNNEIVPLKGYRFEFSETGTSSKPPKSTIENFFVSNRFIVSTMNNKTTPFDTSYGYVREDIKCLVRLTPQSEMIEDIFCGIIDEQEMAWQKELMPAINPKNDPNTKINVVKLIGNYATGLVGDKTGGGGALWYAIKVSGAWKQVWTGQDIISCKPVQQYNIPNEIYGNECSNAY